MMKKIAISVACLVFLPLISFADNSDFGKINFKKTYCNNQDFLGNAASKRPHLHCGTTFMTYKKANGDHSNISEAGDCFRTNAVFDHIKANKNAFENYQAIYSALVSFHQDGCPNQ